MGEVARRDLIQSPLLQVAAHYIQTAWEANINLNTWNPALLAIHSDFLMVGALKLDHDGNLRFYKKLAISKNTLTQDCSTQVLGNQPTCGPLIPP